VGTEFAWRFAEELTLPRAIFVNRMDRDNADFNGTLSQIQSLWGSKCLALQLPIGAQQAFQGEVDLLTMRGLHRRKKGKKATFPPRSPLRPTSFAKSSSSPPPRLMMPLSPSTWKARLSADEARTALEQESPRAVSYLS
jgi:translation elongation factor EF-G